jgi:hypothetical protein
MKPVTEIKEHFVFQLLHPSLSQRRNLLQALDNAPISELFDKDPQLASELIDLYLQDADPAVHNITGQLLDRVGMRPALSESVRR